MPADDKFEDDLLYAISRTGEAFQTGPAPLLAGGLQRGRRRWRRRSAVAVAGGATALALIGTGGVYLAGLGGPAASRTVATAAGAGSGAPARPSASPSATAAAPVSKEEVLAAFTALLPEGGSTAVDGSGTEATPGKPRPTGSAGATVVFDDGRGRAAVGITITRRAPGDTSSSNLDCPDKKFVPFDACTTSTLADGSSLIVYQGYEYPDRRVNTKWWYAELLGKDGRDITLTEWNASKEKDAPITRPLPPLDPAQLTAVVTDRSWDRVVAALPIPEPPAPAPASTAKEYTAEEILAITAGLLPAGLHEAETGGESGYANFTLDDGKGRSMVELNVQDWSAAARGHKEGAGTDDSIARLFADAETLPDGTKVKVDSAPESADKGAAAKGARRWTVDTLRTDGLRVVVSAYNAGGPLQAVTRATPALTQAQLQAIATSPLWKPKR